MTVTVHEIRPRAFGGFNVRFSCAAGGAWARWRGPLPSKGASTEVAFDVGEILVWGHDIATADGPPAIADEGGAVVIHGVLTSTDADEAVLDVAGARIVLATDGAPPAPGASVRALARHVTLEAAEP